MREISALAAAAMADAAAMPSASDAPTPAASEAPTPSSEAPTPVPPKTVEGLEQALATAKAKAVKRIKADSQKIAALEAAAASTATTLGVMPPTDQTEHNSTRCAPASMATATSRMVLAQISTETIDSHI